ncbi:MAG: hypothetical protein M3417_16355 [Actinomycetota bacterium]|nr:hypothetical protein [Actinomycetota bacterium]
MRAHGAATAGLLGVLSAVALGCGSDTTLLGQVDAAGLKDTLEQVRSAVDARDCSLADARLRELRSDVGNLPGTVDRELRVRLREEVVDKLAPAVEDECDSPKTEAQPTVTEEVPTAPAPTEPEPTTPPPTEETETTPPPTLPTETTPPDDSPVPPPVPGPVPEDPTRDPGGFGEDSGGDG